MPGSDRDSAMAVSSAEPPSSRPSYLTGALWATLNAGSSVLLPFALFVFFAREMSPVAIGLVALSMACTELFKALGLPGVYEALLQQKTDLPRFDETTLALLLVASGVMVPACLATLYGLGHVVHGLRPHYLALSLLVLRIPLDLVSVQPQAVLVRRLAFARLALRTIVANLVAGALGFIVSLVVSPFLGLITYQLGQSLLSFASTAVGKGLLARPRLHMECVRRLREQMLLATGNRTLAASINYADQMVIAPLAGGIALAYYNLGKRLENTFVTVASSFSSILFQPLFASDGVLSRQKATSRSLIVLSVLCGAPAAIVFSNSQAVVGLIFGRKWVVAAPIVAWLSLNGFVRAVGMVPGSFLSVSGRNRQLLVTSIASAAGSLLAVAALASTSVLACAIGLALKNVAIVGWMAWLSRSEVRDPTRLYLVSVVLPTSCMIAAGSAVATLLPLSPAPRLSATLTAVGASGVASLLAAGLAIAGAHLWSSRHGCPASTKAAVP